jgi:hypothetical protein
MENAIDRKANRRALYNKVFTQFTNKKNITFTFEEWENLFFQNEENCVTGKASPADGNGYVKQGNLFDILTHVNKRGKIIKDEFLKNGSSEYNSLSDKVTFVKIYACFDFDWTTTSTTKYCGNAEKSKTDTKTNTNTSTSTINLPDYIGAFKTKEREILNIIMSGENGIQKLKINAEHLPSGMNSFFLEQSSDKYTFDVKLPSDVSSKIVDLLKDKKSTIKFANDLQSFDYDLAGLRKGTATKVKYVENKKTDNKKKVQDDDDDDDTNDGNVIINKKVYNYPDVNVKDEPPIEGNRDCDDYPFKPGCINDDIGDLNLMFFNDRRGNVFGTRLLKKLNSMGLISPNDKNPEITPEIFNQVMSKFKKNVIKESVKKVLKEYTNKKK